MTSEHAAPPGAHRIDVHQHYAPPYTPVRGLGGAMTGPPVRRPEPHIAFMDGWGAQAKRDG